ncbi:DUF6470 family protein [Peribacillus simplex]|uniref:DUF6470 family protein n=2 Tax=Peribacillus TaxID=2675229 RepID=A0AA90NXW1_9BACI|nr:MULTISPECIES: DUF6470 family protein [Peribacillus]MDP1416873.1 DUF6470 family protein [Peribacillus simplex]MDP1449528.1 DUF6470 family protein [Peribacillus frigoritolerans]
MQIPQIRLQSTPMKIGLNIEQSVQQIEQKAAVQSIEQPQAILEIQTTPGKLTIDQSQAREDMDLKSLSRRVDEFAQQGYQDWLAGMARRSQQGTELRHIEKGGNALADQARQNSKGPEKRFNLGWIPSHFSVKLDYQPAQVKIEATAQKPIIDAQINSANHTYTPGSVDVEILQKNALDIEFINIFRI